MALPSPTVSTWSTASSAVSTPRATPSARPAADSSAIRMTASPLAESQPKNAAPHLRPPKRTRWATTASRAVPRVADAPSVRSEPSLVRTGTVWSTCVWSWCVWSWCVWSLPTIVGLLRAGFSAVVPPCSGRCACPAVTWANPGSRAGRPTGRPQRRGGRGDRAAGGCRQRRRITARRVVAGPGGGDRPTAGPARGSARCRARGSGRRTAAGRRGGRRRGGGRPRRVGSRRRAGGARPGGRCRRAGGGRRRAGGRGSAAGGARRPGAARPASRRCGSRRPRLATRTARREGSAASHLIAHYFPAPRVGGGRTPMRGGAETLLTCCEELNRPMPIPSDTGAPLNVLITGASSGIGRATALELAGRGAALVLTARGRESLEETAAEVRAAGAAEAMVCPTDVNDADAVEAVVTAAVQRLGRLDVVVHSAQVMAYGRIEDLPREVYETVVDTGVHGTANIARAVLPVFRRQGAGHLVVVNSLLGSIAAPLMGSYVAAKWGQLGLVRVLQHETRDVPGISISAVQPGGVNPPIYVQAGSWAGSTGRPPPPVYSPQRVMRAVVSTIDRPRRIVQSGLLNPLVAAGFRFFPGLYDLLVC